MTPAEATLLYDGDCGFCRWSADAVLRLDRRRRLRMLALQSEEASGLLPGMSQERRMSSWHLVAADGRVWSGGSAIAPLLRRLPGGRPAAAGISICNANASIDSGRASGSCDRCVRRYHPPSEHGSPPNAR